MDLLERFAPKEYACSWDNVGLLIGRADQEIQRVIVALDATNAVVDRAVAEGADLIITHHPMIFSSMKRVNDDGFLGNKILKLVENRISVFAMHTNFDVIGMAAPCRKVSGFSGRCTAVGSHSGRKRKNRRDRKDHRACESGHIGRIYGICKKKRFLWNMCCCLEMKIR